MDRLIGQMVGWVILYNLNYLINKPSNHLIIQ